MNKVWLLFFSAVFIQGLILVKTDDDDLNYWENDYDDQWYNDELEKLGILEDDGLVKPDAEQSVEDINLNADKKDSEDFDEDDQSIPLNSDTTNEKVEDEIQQFLKKLDENKDTDSVFDDYQFEDNRSEENSPDDADKSNDHVSANNADFGSDEDFESISDVDDEIKTKDEIDLIGDLEDDQIINNSDIEENLPVPVVDNEEIKEIIEETKNILDNDEHSDNFEDLNQEEGLKVDTQPNIEEIIDETNKILAESDNNFSNREAESINAESVDDESFDFKDNLAVLFEKLDNEEATDNNISPILKEGKIENQEEKSVSEDTVNELNDGDNDTDKQESHVVETLYEDLNEDLDALLAKMKELSFDGSSNEDISLDTKDVDFSELFKDLASKEIEPEKSDSYEDTLDVESIGRIINKIKNENVQNSKEVNNLEEENNSIDKFSSDEVQSLTQQFIENHKSDLDVHSEVFDENIAPIYITLSVDEPTIITSPNYPSNYPTNNVIDWIFDGDEGQGIELNITDFTVNSILGDYLLVKPGGREDFEHESLVFAYHLNSEKRYRFTDVNKLFIRFESKVGMAFTRGFNISLRMLEPLPQVLGPEEEPEAIVAAPTSTLTISLGGVNYNNFSSIKEDFRILLADMATMYINKNNIEMNVNSTYDVTQIVEYFICNINWPNFENCVDVKFGIPVTDDEENPRLDELDLKAMWYTYVFEDPFAIRLRRMGIVEFSIPNDGSVLTAWLVVAAGVVISVMMLGFALWRFSCFEDYSRMSSVTDTDSIQKEKRALDLYPTPHQPLPRLYANEYTWADDSRVDMGGLANQSYTRDELFDIDSDEEVLATREKYTTDV